MANYLVQLATPDGRVFAYTDSFPDDATPDDVTYYYQDGSLACDCNRSFLLHRHHGLPVCACGHTIRLVSLTAVPAST